MAAVYSSDHQVTVLRDTIIALVREDGPDLSARQLGIMLIVYLNDGPHTVRGLASELKIAKPAVTRALDKLEGLDFAKRRMDPSDRRSVVIQKTPQGAQFMQMVRELMNNDADTQKAEYLAA